MVISFLIWKIFYHFIIARICALVNVDFAQKPDDATPRSYPRRAASPRADLRRGLVAVVQPREVGLVEIHPHRQPFARYQRENRLQIRFLRVAEGFALGIMGCRLYFARESAASTALPMTAAMRLMPRSLGCTPSNVQSSYSSPAKSVRPSMNVTSSPRASACS